MFAEAYLKLVADTIVSEIVARGLGAIIDGAVDPIKISIDRIEQKIESQSLVHLKAGMTFLRLGELDQAVSELVRAEAADSMAPVPSFWLGVALVLTGRRGDGRLFLQRAVSGNPFLLSGMNSSIQLPIIKPQFGIEEQDFWQSDCQISELAKHPVLRPPWWKRWAMDMGRRSSVAAMANLGSYLLIQFNLDGDCERWSREDKSATSSIIAVLDPSANPIWLRRVESEFIFATPAYALFKYNDLYSIIETSGGHTIREFGREYLESAYFPNLNNIIESDMLHVTNFYFKSCKDVFKIKKGRDFEFVDGGVVAGDVHSFYVENKWNLKYRRARGGPVSKGIWSVNCRSIIKSSNFTI